MMLAAFWLIRPWFWWFYLPYPAYGAVRKMPRRLVVAMIEVDFSRLVIKGAKMVA